MMKTLKYITTSLLLIISFSIYADIDHDDAKKLVESGEILSLEKILVEARKIQSGKVLEVELEKKDGLTIYEVELLNSQGIIFELKFDAETGKHLSTEKED